MLSNTEEVNTTRKYIRQFMGFIDRIVFVLLGTLFDVFFSLAKSDIVNNQLMKSLIGRFQLIIGVVFLFIFAVHIVQGIINPDLFTDSTKGTAKVISKIIISLFLFSSLLPLNIPNAASNSYEEQLSNQGILFGTMTFFQNVVLENNVLAKLVLGNEGGNNEGSFGYKICSTDPNTGEESCDNNASFGQYTAAMIAKLFVFPNMMPDATTIQEERDGSLYALCINDDGFYNPDADISDALEGKEDVELGRYQWYSIENRPGEIFGYVDNECTLDENGDWWSGFAASLNAVAPLTNAVLGPLSLPFNFILGSLDGRQVWQFQYLSPFSTIVGILLVFFMISNCVEIAIRIFKLAILRVLGPVAALSYASPGESNKMFSSWSSNLVSVFIDVFVRLLIIYFVLFVVSSVLTNGIGMQEVGLLGKIFIVIALFAFAKQAPKYVRQVLGLPESSNGMFGGLFGGIGSMLAAGGTIAGLGAAGLGAIGAARNAAQSSREADAERKRLGEDVNPDALGNRAKHLLAGIVGFGQGASRGTKATFGADKDKLGAATSAIAELNALKAARGRNGSTLLGRMGENLSALSTGRSALEEQERQMAYYNGVSSTARSLADYVKKKAVGEYGDTAGFSFSGVDANGRKVTLARGTTYNDILNARAEARAKGQKTFTLNGHNFNTEGQATDDFVDASAGKLSKAYGSWQKSLLDYDKVHEGEDGYEKQADQGFVNYYNSATDNGVDGFINNPKVAVSKIFEDENDMFDSYKLGKASGAASGEAKAIENSAEYALHKANQPGGPKN